MKFADLYNWAPQWGPSRIRSQWVYNDSGLVVLHRFNQNIGPKVICKVRYELEIEGGREGGAIVILAYVRTLEPLTRQFEYRSSQGRLSIE